MKLGVKLVVIMLALAYMLASAYVANAGMGGSVDQQTEQATNGHASSDNRNSKVVPVATSSGKGATRVDRDFGADHESDSNQFGDDRAYDSSEGHTNREADYQAHHWVPESYGQMGSYGHDEK